MKLLMMLSKVLKYLLRSRKEKLYQQWVKRGGLPPEAIPREEVGGEIIPKIHRRKLRLHPLYVLLAAAVVLFCVGLILLIGQSC